MILLARAALLIQSIVRLRRIEPGFNPQNVLTMGIALPPGRYDTDLKWTAFYNELIRRVEGLPRVRSAALAFTAPFSTFALTPIRPVSEELFRSISV